MNKDTLENYLKDGLNAVQISIKENLSITTTRYWLRKYKLRTRRYFGIDKEKLINVIKNSKSYNEIFSTLGKNASSNNYKILKQTITKLEIDTSHFIKIKTKIKLTKDNIFVKNCRHSRSRIKFIIIRDKIIEYKCSLCSQDENWRGHKISLILDHINGVNNDYRLENLRFVCPNCNASLPTFCRGSKGI